MTTDSKSFSTLVIAVALFGLAGAAVAVLIPVVQSTFGLTLMAFYMVNFIDFLRHPDRAVIGYKG